MSYSEYSPASTDGDLLPVVDEHDNVVGSATRREVHARNLLHRAVHVVVVNARGEVLLQKRSERKDTFGGWWDISVGGHVDVGEDYEATARRELREEMGIEAPFREVGRLSPAPITGWEFVRIYECRFDGEPNPNPEEVTASQWLAPEDLFAGAEKNPPSPCVTPSGLNSIRLWATATNRLPPRG